MTPTGRDPGGAGTLPPSGQTPLGPGQDRAHRVVDRTAQAVEAGADRARDGVDRGVDAVKRGTERARQAAHSAIDRVEDVAGSTRERLDRVGEKTLADVAADVTALVRRHPGPALAVAAIVGFWLGTKTHRS